MKKTWLWQIAVGGLLLAAHPVSAAQVGLADWCVNVNGNWNTSNACNGGTGPALSAVNITAGQTSPWDTSLEDGVNNNGLGSITVTLGSGAAQFVAVYLDYDVDYNTYASYDDNTTTAGSLPTGFSWETDNPSFGNIGGDFTSFNNSTPFGNVDNSSVNNPAGANQCCDVAAALGIAGIDVPDGQNGTVVFTVSNVAPATGFYIQQTSNDGVTNGVPDSIFITAAVSFADQQPSSTPEPSTAALVIGAGLTIAGLLRRNRFTR
jgi:hypothetical protein